MCFYVVSEIELRLLARRGGALEQRLCRELVRHRDFACAGGAHRNAAHASDALEIVCTRQVLFVNRSGRAVFVAHAASDAGDAADRANRRLKRDEMLRHGRNGGTLEARAACYLAEEVLELLEILRVGTTLAVFRRQGVRCNHLTGRSDDEFALFKGSFQLRHRVACRPVAVYRHSDRRAAVTFNVLHAVMHGLRDPAAVDRNAEDGEPVLVDVGADHFGLGRNICCAAAKVFRDVLRDLARTARGAEVKYDGIHVRSRPFGFVL